jgi:hypothetical protein
VHSAEEQLLQLIAFQQELAGKVDEAVFEDERNRGVFKRLRAGEAITAILSSMEESDVEWLRPLFIEERKYSFPDHVLNTLVRDLNTRKLREEFQALEPVVLKMITGDLQKDDSKIQRYHQLIHLLKGSVK